MCIWGDSYVTLLTAAMLEVYLLQQCTVVNLPVFADCCVELFASRKTRSANKIGVLLKETSNI